MMPLPRIAIALLLACTFLLPATACKGKKKRGQLAARATAAATLDDLPTTPAWDESVDQP